MEARMKRAFLAKTTISTLLSRYYGLRMLSYKELSGYDDKNILVRAETEGTNQNIQEICCHGYVLKVVNSLDSKNTKIIAAQHEMMSRVYESGIPTPRPVPTLTGYMYFTMELPTEEYDTLGTTAVCHSHLVHLYNYIPGSTLTSVPLTEGLCYKVGVMAGRIDMALTGLKHAALLDHHWRWHLDFIPSLHGVLHVIQNAADRELASDVFNMFQSRVLVHIDELPTGTIHSDINEGNILISKRAHTDVWNDDYDLAAILDYGDISYFPYIFEVAIAMAHMSIMSINNNPLPVQTASGYVLAGYMSHRILSDYEISLLKICMCARMAQALVITADPENTYRLNSGSNGWSRLRHLWNMEQERLDKEWQEIKSRCERKN